MPTPSTAQVNQQMLGVAQDRDTQLGGVQDQINTDLADPTTSQVYGSQLTAEQGQVTDAQGVLGGEIQDRQALANAYANSTYKNPDQDPAVQKAQQDLNDYRKKNAKYYKNGKVADPCIPCMLKALKFRTPPEVIKAAQDLQRSTGVPASITLGQWALESGYGKSMPPGSNNPFGIKAGKGQPFVAAMTSENYGHGNVRVMQNFLKFDSLTDAFADHSRLIATAPVYAKARADEGDPDKMAQDLQGTYATSTTYAHDLTATMQSNNYYQYDTLPAEPAK